MERYIGLDAHAASCTLAVISQTGRRLKDFPVETNGQALVEAIRMIPGRKHLVLEEGLQSAWLYETLRPHVDEIVVAGVTESRGVEERQARRLRPGGEAPHGLPRQADLQGASRVHAAPGPLAQAQDRADPGDGSRDRSDSSRPARPDRGHAASLPDPAAVRELLRPRDRDPFELRLGAGGRRRMDPGPGPADAGVVSTVQPRAEGHLQGRSRPGHHAAKQRSALPSLRTDARRRDEAESRQAHACAHHRSDRIADVEGRGGVSAGAEPARHGVRPQRVGDLSGWKMHEKGAAALSLSEDQPFLGHPRTRIRSAWQGRVGASLAGIAALSLAPTSSSAPCT